MERLASAATRSAAVAVAFVAALGASRCGSVVEAEAALEGVIGVDADCASRVTQIHVEVTRGAAVEVDASFPVRGPADLPIGLSLPSTQGGQAEHQVTVDYHLGPSTSDGEPAVATIGPFGYADGTTGRVVYILPCTCIGVACPSGQSCAELPVGSGHAVCVRPAKCGDHVCDAGEQVTCADDCTSTCSGDGVCDQGESCATCPVDCGSCCGDGKCEDTETEASCPVDCNVNPNKPVCGDGKCDGGEDCQSCASDCCCTDPCCIAPGPCCGSTDPCCGNPDPCCGSADPCCGSADPCCGKQPDGGGCSADGQCCSGHCGAGICGPPCAPDGASCASPAQCCTGMCTAGACGAPPRVTTVVVTAANDVATPASAVYAQLFFITNLDPSWDEAKSAWAPFPNHGAEIDLTFDFSSNPKWTGTITGLRFDPMNCGTSPACDAACFNVGRVSARDSKGALVKTWDFVGAAESPIPNPFHGWTLVAITSTWTDGAYFGGCVDPAIPPPAYGDIQIQNDAVGIQVQP